MPTLVPHAPLAKLLGEQVLEIEARSIREMIDHIISRIGKQKWKELRRVTILLNGRNINFSGGRETPLEPGDRVWMVVPSGGG